MLENKQAKPIKEIDIISKVGGTYIVKQKIIEALKNCINQQILVIDISQEYLVLAHNLGGEVIKLSEINELDISKMDKNMFIVFDVSTLNLQANEKAASIIFKHIWNKLNENQSSGISTWVYCNATLDDDKNGGTYFE